MKKYLKKVTVICLAILMMIISVMPIYAQTRNLLEDISSRTYSNEENRGE